MSLFPVILDVLVVDSGKERRLLAEPGLTPPAHLSQTGSAECRIKDYRQRGENWTENSARTSSASCRSCGGEDVGEP